MNGGGPVVGDGAEGPVLPGDVFTGAGRIGPGIAPAGPGGPPGGPRSPDPGRGPTGRVIPVGEGAPTDGGPGCDMGGGLARPPGRGP